MSRSIPIRNAWFILDTLLIVSIGLLVYPMVVIQPFRAQGEKELKIALWLVQWRGHFEGLAAFGAIATLMFFRRRLSAWAYAPALLICAAAVMARVNVFEMMFHRYDKPAFAKAADAKVEADDKVLAILVNGQARAYPIRTIAYHHIINDEVGGQPVVATY